MKTINKIIYSLVGIVALPLVVRSCSIAQSNTPYLQGDYKGSHYSFAGNGIFGGQTYKIIMKDGTKLRCDDLDGDISHKDNIIDSVIEYDKDNEISKIYKNSLKGPDENDEFLTKLTAQVKEAKRYITQSIEDSKKEQLEKEQSDLLKKVIGDN